MVVRVLCMQGGEIDSPLRGASAKKLRSLTHSTFQGDCLAAHVFEVRGGELDADAADFFFYIAKMSHRRNFYVCLECVRVSLLEFFKLGCPGKRADDIHIDSVRCESW